MTPKKNKAISMWERIASYACWQEGTSDGGVKVRGEGRMARETHNVYPAISGRLRGGRRDGGRGLVMKVNNTFIEGTSNTFPVYVAAVSIKTVSPPFPPHPKVTGWLVKNKLT